LAKYRSAVGIIFQFYNLLPNLNTIENILMDEWVGGGWPTEAEAIELSEKFNLKPGQKANARTLSGGEKQRVAICRALLGKPKILFCDEPTGALDSQNEEQVKQILVDLNKAGMTVVMVTHNQLFAEIAIQIVSMQDGSIVDNKPNRKDLKIVNRKQL
jgi:putative ABC transport system ATP-binding protein